MRLRAFSTVLLALFVMSTLCTRASAATTVDDLRKEVEALRKRLNEKPSSSPIGKVDAMTSSKFGPNAAVTTKTGKLQIGGLLQIWNYSIENDERANLDVFDDRSSSVGVGGTGEVRDNNGYRIRRSEIKFTMDIHENITAHVMIDPARQATSFAPLPSNQGLFKSDVDVAPEFDDANGPGLGSTAQVLAVQTGAGRNNSLLQDAYINYHGVIPHHDFTIGQFKPKIGEEGIRNSAYLDFAERAMITQGNDLRDLGVEVHGTWWDDRVQYWAGLFDGAGNFFNTGGDFQNRSDDNDAKDFTGRILVRPIWNCGPWGSMELGYSGQFGTHGEAGDDTADGSGPINGLNRNQSAAIRHGAWAYYKPMGPVRGWWLRGEYGYQKDRTTPLSVNVFALGSGPNGEQAAPGPFSRDGWFFSTGYKLSDSFFAERLSKGGFWNRLMEPVEFTFRYETFQNIITQDLVNPDRHSDQFGTNVWTAGVNYYVKAYNMRVQVNYMVVDEDDDRINNAARDFREVNNNIFIVTYQVAF